MREHPSMKTGESGFTLIEVLFAMVILSIGIMGVATMQGTAIKGNSTGRGYTEATAIGTSWMETLSMLDYSDTLLVDTDAEGSDGHGTDGLGDGVADADHTAVAGQNSEYTVFWNIADNEFTQETKTVALYVTWQHYGDTRSVRMRGLIPQIR